MRYLLIKGHMETAWTILRKFDNYNDIKLRDDLIVMPIKKVHVSCFFESKVIDFFYFRSTKKVVLLCQSNY